MHFLVIALIVLAVVFGPSLWARSVMKRHAGERSDFPGTGGELARHLLDESDLQGVGVEITEAGDHYDPKDRVVRLSKGNHDGRSLTAVVVAAHEVGHALQHRDSYGPLIHRHRLVRATALFQRAGSFIALISPFFFLLSRSPLLMLGLIGVGVLSMASAVVVHLVTLPVEFNASFARALPILDRGGYLPKRDLPAARRILQAAALTYVASSLTSLLNLWQWIRYLR